MTHPRVLNLADVVVRTLEPDEPPKGAPPAGYDVRWGDIASRIGARQLGCNLTVVAPGKRNCPFHNHHAEEELFVILEGDGELRYGDTRCPLRAGDVIACPTGGRDTAHQIVNTGAVEMRYLAISTMAPVEICEYPDSNKVLGYAVDEHGDARTRRFRRMFRDGADVDYWDGE